MELPTYILRNNNQQQKQYLQQLTIVYQARAVDKVVRLFNKIEI